MTRACVLFLLAGCVTRTQVCVTVDRSVGQYGHERLTTGASACVDLERPENVRQAD
jgi:hypothetical protein